MTFNPTRSDFESYNLPKSFASSKSNWKQYNNQDISEEATNHFNKKYCLKRSENFTIPDVASWYVDDNWKVEKFQLLKEKLNNVKSNLNGVQLKTWHQHTNYVNRSAKVIPLVKRVIKPQLITQAWCKFHEIIHSYPIIPEIEDAFTSVHLCEAPGAFITSLNHYLKSDHPHIEWDWIGNTLNPHHESNSFEQMISDDRLILWTTEKWYFGPDNTGNILQSDFISHFLQYIQHNVHTKILLITADGSIDCQGNPGEQEILVGNLHYREIQTALSLLEPNGNLVVKMFTLFECESICLIYLVRCLFDQVHFYKPATSKEGNSEIYVICLQYKKSLSHDQIERLHNSVAGKVLFPLHLIGEDFLEDLYKGVSMFTDLQINAIERNLSLFQSKVKTNMRECKQLDKVQSQIANLFLHRYQLRPLYDASLFIKFSNQSVKQTLSFDGRIENGTYKERLAKENLTLSQYILEELEYVDEACSRRPSMCWIENIGDCNVQKYLHIIKGKPISKINSSIFCLARLFKLFYEVRKLDEGDSVGVNHVNVNRSQISLKSREKLYLSYLVQNQIDTSNMTIVDLTSYCDLLTPDVSISQLKLLDKLLEVLDVLPPNNHLLLINMPLLTQFCVSIVMVLAALFQKTGSILLHDSTLAPHSSHAILFHNLVKNDLTLARDIQTQYSDTLTHSHNEESIVSFLPVRILCDQQSLFKSVFQINCCTLKNHLLELIRTFHNQD